MDFALGDEQRDIRDTVRTFVADQLLRPRLQWTRHATEYTGMDLPTPTGSLVPTELATCADRRTSCLVPG